MPLVIVMSLGLSGLYGCASTESHRPIVIGDDLAEYEADLAQCQQLAKQQDNDTEFGTMIGAVGGAILGAAADDALAGAAIGAIAGAIAGEASSSQSQRQLVVQCLRDKGYNVKD